MSAVNHGRAGLVERLWAKRATPMAGCEENKAILSNPDGPEAAATITRLTEQLGEARALLARLGPHLDAIVCFASDMGEHEPNRLAFDVRAFNDQQEAA